jgi:hypothetical protein
MTNTWTVNSQIITLLHAGQHGSNIKIQIVYTANTQTDCIRIVTTNLF